MLSAAIVAALVYGIRKRNLKDEEEYKKLIGGINNKKSKKVYFN
jgi:hypothetical protein